MGNYLGRGLDKISNIEVLDNITFDGSSSYSITKSSVAFTPNSAQSCLVSIDGVVQATNFTVNSSTIDFGVAIPSTSTCNFFLHYGTGLITVPSDGSVTTAKLGDGSVTSAKLDSGVALGKVLQIVTASNDTTMRTTTSTSFATTGTTASITPSSTSSKIYVISSCDVDLASTGTIQFLTIFRGSTNIGLSTTADGGQNGLCRIHDVAGGRYLFRQMLQVLDTPNSSSSVTYTLQQRVSQGTARVRNDLIPAQITLMEIA